MCSGTQWIKLGVFAACCILVGASWVLYASAIPSLREEESEAIRAVSVFNNRIGRAQKTISEILAQEKAAGSVHDELKRLHKAFPEGSPTVWLPALAKQHFERFEITARRIHLNGIEDEAGILGYARGYLSVILPVDKAGPKTANLFTAVAEIEQRIPFLTVSDLTIRSDPENPGQQLMSLTLSALVRK